MIISRSKPNSLGVAIFYGGLIAGMLDAVDGFVAYYFAAASTRSKFCNSLPAAFMERLLFKRGFPAPWLVSSPIFSSPSRPPPSTWEQTGFCPC
jgi:hypothetical protein